MGIQVSWRGAKGTGTRIGGHEDKAAGFGSFAWHCLAEGIPRMGMSKGAADSPEGQQSGENLFGKTSPGEACGETEKRVWYTHQPEVVGSNNFK